MHPARIDWFLASTDGADEYGFCAMMEQERNLVPRSVSPNDGNIAQRVILITSSPLFANLSERECLQIASCAGTRSFTRNESLFSQGQPVHELILLQSGKVKHTQVSSSGHEVLLRFSRTGDVIGLHVDHLSGRRQSLNRQPRTPVPRAQPSRARP